MSKYIHKKDDVTIPILFQETLSAIVGLQADLRGTQFECKPFRKRKIGWSKYYYEKQILKRYIKILKGRKDELQRMARRRRR